MLGVHGHELPFLLKIHGAAINFFKTPLRIHSYVFQIWIIFFHFNAPSQWNNSGGLGSCLITHFHSCRKDLTSLENCGSINGQGHDLNLTLAIQITLFP